jgi:hypothetical protein
VTAPPTDIDLGRAAVQTALAALREGRSTGNATLDQVADALGRRWARAWAHLRSACPHVAEAEIDLAADRVVDVLASLPTMVVRMVVADAASCADAGGAS